MKASLATTGPLLTRRVIFFRCAHRPCSVPCSRDGLSSFAALTVLARSLAHATGYLLSLRSPSLLGPLLTRRVIFFRCAHRPCSVPCSRGGLSSFAALTVLARSLAHAAGYLLSLRSPSLLGPLLTRRVIFFRCAHRPCSVPCSRSGLSSFAALTVLARSLAHATGYLLSLRSPSLLGPLLTRRVIFFSQSGTASETGRSRSDRPGASRVRRNQPARSNRCASAQPAIATTAMREK